MDAANDDRPFGPGESEVPEPLYRDYERLLRQVCSLPELPMMAAMVERRVLARSPAEQAWYVDQILRGALWGQSGGGEAALAMVCWVLRMRRDEAYEQLKVMYLAAHDAGREAVVSMFRNIPPHKALAGGQQLPEVRLPKDSEVTLGERRAMAAGREYQLLKRLLMDPDPLVIRKLLRNRQLRLADIKVIATRRPTVPEILWEIAMHPRWFRREEVREALVRNPYGETGMALTLLPSLGIRTLRRIAHSGDLHEEVQKSAARLVTLREERTAPWRV